MIRRIIRADLADVRALAREAKRLTVNTWHHAFFAQVHREGGCVIIGPGAGVLGAGFAFGPEPDRWPDHARLLTIGRVTLAAWGGRTS